MSIPHFVWQRVVDYIGLEKTIKKNREKRDWRFEEARASINRCWKTARSCVLTRCWQHYVGNVKRLKILIKSTRRKHFKPALCRAMMLAELRYRNKCNSLLDWKMFKAYKCYDFCKGLSRDPSVFLHKPSATFFDLNEHNIRVKRLLITHPITDP